MVKLSQQLRKGSVRQTRTQRVQQQQEQLKQRRDFESLRQKANSIREQRFSQIRSIEEYESEYNKLDSELKPFFASPEEVKQQDSARREADKKYLLERAQTFLEQAERLKPKIKEIDSEYREKIRNAQTTKEKNKLRERKYQRVRELERRIMVLEDKAYGLRSNIDKIEQGYTANSIRAYVEDRADLRGEKSESKFEQKFEELKQQNRIQELLEAGGEPILVERTNPKTKEVTGVEFDILGADFDAIPLDIKKTANLKKSDAGRAKLEQSFIYGGKKFTFPTSADIFVGEEGKLTTSYGDVILKTADNKVISTEEQYQEAIEKAIIKEQDRIIKENSEKLEKKPKFTYIPEDTRTRAERNIEESGFKDFEARQKERGSDIDYVSASKELGVGKAILNTLKKIVPFASVKDPAALRIAGIPIKTRKDQRTLAEDKEEALTKISDKQQEILLGEIERTGVKAEKDARFQEIAQTEFERQFFEDIVREKITFEEAETKFKESELAGQIEKQYTREIKLARAGKITGESVKIVGLEFLKLPIKVTPESLGIAGAEAGLAYTGVKAFKVIPPSIINVGTAGIGAYGLYKGLSKKASPEEKVTGLITAGISVTILSAQAVKYLRTPTIKQKTIVFKTKQLPKELQKGFVTPTERQVYSAGGKSILVEDAKVTKASQKIIYGRRTIVSTKFRDLLRLKPIYQGIPQKASAIKIEGLRGTSYIKGISDRDKAIQLLTKRAGYSVKEANKIIRLSYPKYIESLYQADIRIISGDAIGKPIVIVKGTRTITQPVLNVNKALGIKTRGAKTIKELISGKGVILGEGKGVQVAGLKYDVTKVFVTKDGRLFQRLTQAGKTTKQQIQLTSTKEIEDRILRIQKNFGSGIDKIDDFAFKEYSEKSLARQIVPRGKLLTSEGKSAVFKKEVPTIFIDSEKISGISVKEILKTGTKKSSKALIKDIGEVDNKLLSKLVKKLDKVPSSPVVTALKEPSQQAVQSTGIKAALEPLQAERTALKISAKIAQASASASKASVAVIAGSAIKTEFSPRLSLKINQIAKAIEDTAIRSDSANIEAQLTAQASKLDLRTQLDTRINIPKIPRSVITDPIINIKTPPEPTINIPLEFVEKRILKKKKRKSTDIEKFARLPDFTSRALGLKPLEYNEKQAEREIRKILSGLETRRGLKVIR